MEASYASDFALPLASGHDVARPLDVHQRQAPLVVDREARDRIVARVGGEEEPVVPAQDDAARALEGIRCALAVDDRVVAARPGAARRDAVDLFDRAVPGPAVVDDGIVDLVGLNVEMSTAVIRHAHLVSTCSSLSCPSNSSLSALLFSLLIPLSSDVILWGSCFTLI